MKKKYQKKHWLSDIEYQFGDPDELHLTPIPEMSTEYNKFYMDTYGHLWIQHIKPTESQVCQHRMEI